MSSGDGFLESYLPYQLRRADQAISAAFYAALNHYGVARSEWRLLAVLHERDGLSVLDLTEASLCPQPTVTHAVRRLEERGLVTRRPGKTDKRQRFISRTRTGAKLTATLIDEAKRLEADALANVGDLSKLVEQLNDLTARVQANAVAQPSASDTHAEAG